MYRLNAYTTTINEDSDEENINSQNINSLQGRLQGWTDPSLTRSDPSFVVRHPSFHRPLHQSAGCMCVAHIPDFVVQVGAPEGVPILQVNHLTMLIESTYEFEVEINQDDDGPVEVVQRLQSYLFNFLSWYDDGSEKVWRFRSQ